MQRLALVLLFLDNRGPCPNLESVSVGVVGMAGPGCSALAILFLAAQIYIPCPSIHHAACSCLVLPACRALELQSCARKQELTGRGEHM